MKQMSNQYYNTDDLAKFGDIAEYSQISVTNNDIYLLISVLK